MCFKLFCLEKLYICVLFTLWEFVVNMNILAGGFRGVEKPYVRMGGARQTTHIAGCSRVETRGYSVPRLFFGVGTRPHTSLHW